MARPKNQRIRDCRSSEITSAHILTSGLISREVSFFHNSLCFLFMKLDKINKINPELSCQNLHFNSDCPKYFTKIIHEFESSL